MVYRSEICSISALKHDVFFVFLSTNLNYDQPISCLTTTYFSSALGDGLRGAKERGRGGDGTGKGGCGRCSGRWWWWWWWWSRCASNVGGVQVNMDTRGGGALLRKARGRFRGGIIGSGVGCSLWERAFTHSSTLFKYCFCFVLDFYERLVNLCSLTPT